MVMFTLWTLTPMVFSGPENTVSRIPSHVANTTTWPGVPWHRQWHGRVSGETSINPKEHGHPGGRPLHGRSGAQ